MRKRYRFFIAITTLIFSGPVVANGPTIKLDEKLNPIQKQESQQKQEAQQTTKYDMVPQLDTETVTEIQTKLEARGLSPGPVDGKWKPETERALRKWQAQAGFEATGQPDQKTLSALNIQPSAIDGENQIQAQETMDDKNMKDRKNSQELTDTTSADPSIENASEKGQAGLDRELIKQTQNRLDELGWNLNADGILGEKTKNALREFQQESDLTVTGELNRETLRALKIEEEAFAE